MLFALQPKKAVGGDLNNELVNVYRCVRDDCETVIAKLGQLENTPECFYRLRALDRNDEAFRRLTSAERAARMLYLNKTCYNGLYRVNILGQMNSPFGRYKNPNIVNAEGLQAVSRYLRERKVKLVSGSYEKVLREASQNSFVYLDPPYDSPDGSASFTGYTRGGFSRADQIRLREKCDILNDMGAKFMLSNAATEFIKDQYTDYRIVTVKARRAVSCNGNGRGQVDEVVIMNYEPPYIAKNIPCHADVLH